MKKTAIELKSGSRNVGSGRMVRGENEDRFGVFGKNGEWFGSEETRDRDISGCLRPS